MDENTRSLIVEKRIEYKEWQHQYKDISMTFSAWLAKEIEYAEGIIEVQEETIEKLLSELSSNYTPTQADSVPMNADLLKEYYLRDKKHRDMSYLHWVEQMLMGMRKTQIKNLSGLVSKTAILQSVLAEIYGTIKKELPEEVYSVESVDNHVNNMTKRKNLETTRKWLRSIVGVMARLKVFIEDEAAEHGTDAIATKEILDTLIAFTVKKAQKFPDMRVALNMLTQGGKILHGVANAFLYLSHRVLTYSELIYTYTSHKKWAQTAVTEMPDDGYESMDDIADSGAFNKPDMETDNYDQTDTASHIYFPKK